MLFCFVTIVPASKYEYYFQSFIYFTIECKFFLAFNCNIIINEYSINNKLMITYSSKYSTKSLARSYRTQRMSKTANRKIRVSRDYSRAVLSLNNLSSQMFGVNITNNFTKKTRPKHFKTSGRVSYALRGLP